MVGNQTRQLARIYTISVKVRHAVLTKTPRRAMSRYLELYAKPRFLRLSAPCLKYFK